MSDWIGGGAQLSLGPAYWYWDTASGAANDIFMGETGPAVFKMGNTWTDLMTAQNGTDPADKVLTGAHATLEVDLALATLERMEAIMPGFLLKKTGSTVTGYSFARAIGVRHSDIWKQSTFVRIVNGIDSTATFDTIEFWRLAPASDAEFTFDAATQRFLKVQLVAYPDPNHLDRQGRYTFFGSGTI